MQGSDARRIEKAQAFIKSVKMPSQAHIVMEINKEINAAEPDIKRITDLIQRDVAISSTVIKTVNSPFFGVRTHVTSITQALTLLGLSNFHKVVLASQLQEVLSGGQSGDKGFQKFWDHFMGVAKGAELIAKTFMKLGFYDIEDEAFTAGLFHDCGIPLLIRKYPHYVVETFAACSGDPQKLAALETERYGFDHASLSYALATSWGIPEGVCLAILHHHHRDAEVADAYGARIWIILRLADYLAEYVASLKSDHLKEFAAFGEEEDREVLPEAVMERYELGVEDIGDLRLFAEEELTQYLKEAPRASEAVPEAAPAAKVSPKAKKKKKLSWF